MFDSGQQIAAAPPSGPHAANLFDTDARYADMVGETAAGQGEAAAAKSIMRHTIDFPFDPARPRDRLTSDRLAAREDTQ